MSEETTVTIEVDGDKDTVKLPPGVIQFFTEGEHSSADFIGDLVVIGIAHRLHGHAYHSEGEPDDDLVDLDRQMRKEFEERFGASFAEVTGHSH